MKNQNQALVDFLKENGVCQICQLRYLKARGTEYENIEKTFEALKVKYELEINEGGEDLSLSDESVKKKQRLNVCTCCLGLFSNNFQNLLIESILASDIKKYEGDSIVIAISLPMLLQVRQLSMWYALIEKFGKAIHTEFLPDVPIKEATKLILNPIICKKLHKTYDVDNGLMININLSHVNETEEIGQLQKLHQEAFPKDNGRKQNVSRGVLEKQYQPKHLSATLFKKYLPIPPSMPSTMLTMESITLTGPTVFVAGRYRKITRELSHTPWVLLGKRVMDDSIEEIIIRSVMPYFGCEKSKAVFMSSGREDVDVRCLGKGRPFVLEISNSKRITIPYDEARKMEEEIDKSLKVSVRDLQMVTREELVHIKTGEEHKRKFYRALCYLKEPVTLTDLERLNLPNGFETQQKTPIRVLHRRPLHTRPRMVYSLFAYVQRDNPRALVLDIVTQAGTYIKELVHGEFGRTQPSIYSIIRKPVDIIALDVVAIDLDWPKALDNNTS